MAARKWIWGWKERVERKEWGSDSLSSVQGTWDGGGLGASMAGVLLTQKTSQRQLLGGFSATQCRQWHCSPWDLWPSYVGMLGPESPAAPSELSAGASGTTSGSHGHGCQQHGRQECSGLSWAGDLFPHPCRVQREPRCGVWDANHGTCTWWPLNRQ